MKRKQLSVNWVSNINKLPLAQRELLSTSLSGYITHVEVTEQIVKLPTVKDLKSILMGNGSKNMQTAKMMSV